MEHANYLILIGAALVAASVIVSAFASRFGTPLLLVFLALGMLAGEDGPGGIPFNDVHLTYLIGSIALGIILFDGGMRTHISTVRVGITPGIALATLGVAVTAGIVAVFTMWLFDFSLLQGLLLGAIVAPRTRQRVFGPSARASRSAAFSAFSRSNPAATIRGGIPYDRARQRRDRQDRPRMSRGPPRRGIHIAARRSRRTAT